jgi:hypothetical protein
VPFKFNLRHYTEEAATAIGYHCFRGVVSLDTVVYLNAEGDHKGKQSGGGGGALGGGNAAAVTTVGGGLRVTRSRVRGDAAVGLYTLNFVYP